MTYRSQSCDQVKGIISYIIAENVGTTAEIDESDEIPVIETTRTSFILDGHRFNIIEIGMSHQIPILIALCFNHRNEFIWK